MHLLFSFLCIYTLFGLNVVNGADPCPVVKLQDVVNNKYRMEPNVLMEEIVLLNSSAVADACKTTDAYLKFEPYAKVMKKFYDEESGTPPQWFGEKPHEKNDWDVLKEVLSFVKDKSKSFENKARRQITFLDSEGRDIIEQAKNNNTGTTIDNPFKIVFMWNLINRKLDEGNSTVEVTIPSAPVGDIKQVLENLLSRTENHIKNYKHCSSTVAVYEHQRILYEFRAFRPGLSESKIINQLVSKITTRLQVLLEEVPPGVTPFPVKP